jgi:hypothetical protein
LTFTGNLQCRRSSAPQGVTLIGRTSAGERVHLSLLGVVPPDLPAQLEGAEVVRTSAEHYRISSGGRAWTMTARWYLHIDLSAAFYAAVPPRSVPLGKRLFWRLVLAGARTRLAQGWLARSRVER